MKRHQFIKSASLGLVFLSGTQTVLGRTNQQQEPPQLDKSLVEKFVGASHSKMDVVKELLKEFPTLINSAHDWRAGDFETGIGAASHVGYKELVTYFLNNGAQANIFTMTLFGKLDIVKAMLNFNPSLLNAKGPHGYTLLHHADKGGEDALEVKQYIMNQGLKETRFALY